MIAKCPNPPKDNEKQLKQVRFNEKGNREGDPGENKYDQKIYASICLSVGLASKTLKLTRYWEV